MTIHPLVVGVGGDDVRLLVPIAVKRGVGQCGSTQMNHKLNKIKYLHYCIRAAAIDAMQTPPCVTAIAPYNIFVNQGSNVPCMRV